MLLVFCPVSYESTLPPWCRSEAHFLAHICTFHQETYLDWWGPLEVPGRLFFLNSDLQLILDDQMLQFWPTNHENYSSWQRDEVSILCMSVCFLVFHATFSNQKVILNMKHHEVFRDYLKQNKTQKILGEMCSCIHKAFLESSVPVEFLFC